MIPKTIQLPDRPDAQAALDIIRELHQHGYEAFLVGGAVRDSLLGRQPVEFDVATSARPEQVEAVFPRSVSVGASFGVIKVITGDTLTDVATFRRDGEYTDHRRPDSVVFCDAREDAIRRDFTINALFFDPVADKIIDWVGGVEDLQARLLRTVGAPAQRFSEDALRLLRAIRFASDLGFTIHPDTAVAIQTMAPSIAAVSAERIHHDLTYGITRRNPDRYLQLLVDSGLAAQVLPEVLPLLGCEQGARYHPEGDVFVHTKLVLSHLPPGPPEHLAWAALLHDIAKPQTRTVDPDGRIRFTGHAKVGAEVADGIADRLIWSNALRQRVTHMIRRHMDFMQITSMAPATLRRFLSAETIDEELLLHRADCLGSNGRLEFYDYAANALAELRLASGQAPIVPPRWISGNDLMQLGAKPGPWLKHILETLHDGQMNGVFKDREAALAEAESLIQNLPTTARTS